MAPEQKQERQKVIWTGEPLEFICDVFPGDSITLRFTKHGKLYIKPLKVEVWKGTEQTQ